MNQKFIRNCKFFSRYPLSGSCLSGGGHELWEGGRGPGSTRRARATPEPQSLVNTERFRSASTWSREGSGTGCMQAEVHPQEESHSSAVLPAAATCCQTRVSHCSSRVLHAFPKEAASALLLQKGTVLVEESHAEQDGLRSHPRDASPKHILFSPLQALQTLCPLVLVVWVTGSEQLRREIEHQLFKWMAGSSLAAAVSHGLAWLSLQQFAEQERKDSCFHHGGRKMCKTKDTQIQDLTKTQSWGLQNATQIPSGHFYSN